MQAARQLESYESYESYRYRLMTEQVEENKKRNAEKKMKDLSAKRIVRFIKGVSFCSFVFLSLAVMIYQYSTLYEQKYVVNGLNSEIKQMTMDIEEVKSSLDTTISLDNVERVAMTELNMQYPQPEQIVYLQSNWHYALDKDTRTKYLSKEDAKKNENLSGQVYDYIINFAFGDREKGTAVK